MTEISPQPQGGEEAMQEYQDFKTKAGYKKI